LTANIDSEAIDLQIWTANMTANIDPEAIDLQILIHGSANIDSLICKYYFKSYFQKLLIYKY